MNNPGIKTKQLGTPQSTALLTRHQVAAQLNVCNHSVARWTRAGKLRCIKINPRVVRYHPETVKAFIESAAIE